MKYYLENFFSTLSYEFILIRFLYNVVVYNGNGRFDHCSIVGWARKRQGNKVSFVVHTDKQLFGHSLFCLFKYYRIFSFSWNLKLTQTLAGEIILTLRSSLCEDYLILFAIHSPFTEILTLITLSTPSLLILNLSNTKKSALYQKYKNWNFKKKF